MTVGVRLVDVFVGEVDPARECRHAVDDGDLAVRTVVLRHVQYGAKAVEALAADAAFFQLRRVICRQFEHGTDVVVDDAHVHARGGAFFQHGKDRAPQFARRDDEVFEEDEFLRFFQFFDQPRAVFFAGGEVYRLAAIGGGQMPVRIDGARALSCQFAVLVKTAQNRLVLPVKEVLHAVEAVADAVAHAARHLAAAQGQVQESAHGRDEQDGDQPGDLVFGVDLGVDDVQDKKEVEHHHCGDERDEQHAVRIEQDKIVDRRQQRDLDQE